MTEHPKDVSPEAAEPTPAEKPPAEQDESEVGDFITRHVLEKDSVFFEG